MQYFGEPWDAPVCDPDDPDSVPQAPTPVGHLCLDRQAPIREGDQGLLIPFHRGDGRLTIEPHHRECFMRSILGPHFSWKN